MEKFTSFYELYDKAHRAVVTAHSTNIGHAPANSLLGVKKSVEMGCDFVEFSKSFPNSQGNTASD